MKNVCSAYTGSKKSSCNLLAYIYYLAVVEFGMTVKTVLPMTGSKMETLAKSVNMQDLASALPQVQEMIKEFSA